jgi:hypothetical protein
MAGKWTALIPTSEAAPNEPQGLGSLSFSVTATKTTISIKGTLGDGTKVTGTQYMSADGEMPAFFKANVKGHLAGWIRLRDVAATSDLDGSVHWKKPLVTSGYYRAGFNIFRTLIASRHNPIGRSLTLTEPATLPAPNAIVQIYDIESSTVIEEPIYWSPVNRITKINLPALLSLKTTASTGAVTGTFTKSNKFKLTLNGTVYQKQNIASGIVINATKQTTGWFMIIPN